MPAILKRIFLIYNLLLSLVPKKLRSFFIPAILAPSASTSTAVAATATSSPAGLRPLVSPGPHRVMDPSELRRVFLMFDRNGDGRITKEELRDSLENLGIFIPGKDLVDMIGRVDANGDGCVDVHEFEALYRSIMDSREEEEEEADMKEAFDVFDQNGDGFITVDELRSVLASLGLKQGKTLEDCRRMIVNVDIDGDGRVNFREFGQMMKGEGFSALS